MLKRSESEEGAREPVMNLGSAGGAGQRAAVIGASITINGDVAGDEDLVIQGRVEGNVKLPKNQVAVGKEGRVNANVHAKAIEVAGRVEGELRAEERVVVLGSATVVGKILAPRVALEDGCKFKGSVDTMETQTAGTSSKIAGINPGSQGSKEAHAGKE